MRALLAAALALALAAADAPPEVIRLENAQVVVEVVPRLGGRIATLRRPDGENVLAFTAELLAKPASTLPEAAPDGPFLPGNGGTIWFGPQSAWWTQQTVNPQRRSEEAMWPPDPWLEYGRMEVVERAPDRLRLRGPASPVTGLRLATAIHLEADGAVEEEIEAVNASERSVGWDIWPNTRVRSDARVYAPYRTGNGMRTMFSSWDPGSDMPLPCREVDGFLTFDTRLPAGTGQVLHFNKMYLSTGASRLFALAPHDLVVVAARTPAKGTVHHEQAPVEVYQCSGGDPLRDVLELEFHSGYAVLPPGAALRYAVAWRVLPATAGATPEEDVRVVRAHEDAAARLRTLLGDN